MFMTHHMSFACTLLPLCLFTDVVILLVTLNTLSTSSQNGATPLYRASYEGHSNIVDVLLKAGGDPNIAMNVSGIFELNGSFVYQACPWLHVFENDN